MLDERCFKPVGCMPLLKLAVCWRCTVGTIQQARLRATRGPATRCAWASRLSVCYLLNHAAVDDTCKSSEMIGLSCDDRTYIDLSHRANACLHLLLRFIAKRERDVIMCSIRLFLVIFSPLGKLALISFFIFLFFLMIARRTIISGSSGSQSFHRIKAFWVQMI